MQYFNRRFRRILTTLLCAGFPMSGFAQEMDDGTPVYELSPFEVSTRDDRGYLATNQISGTRVNALIKETPVSLEILTSEFLEDTGATGFDDSLRYSAGIFTQTHVDTSSGAGPLSGDRSPSSSAAVGDRRNNAIIIRGFNAPFQQRHGFRIGSYIGVRGAGQGQIAGGRGGITLGAQIDTINVNRMEVVRGPGALLYGLGVISGIVNILPKEPMSDPKTMVSFVVGTEQLRRATIDTTGPLLRKNDGSPLLDFRLMAVYHEEGDWTDHFKEERNYYAGQLKWYPIRGMSIFGEVQHGKTRFEGHGSRSIRDNNDDNWRDPYDRLFTNPFGERNEWGRDNFAGRYPDVWDQAQWSDFWGEDAPVPPNPEDIRPLEGPFNPRSHRITGPDTYYERLEWTATVRAQWRIAQGLDLSVGAYYTQQDIEEFMVNVGVINNRFLGYDLTPAVGAVDPATVFRLPNPRPTGVSDRISHRGIYTWWTKIPATAESTQTQADLRYEFNTPFFRGGEATHSILIGRQDIQDKADIPVGNPTSGEIANALEVEQLLNQGFGYNENNDPVMVRDFYDWSTPIRYQGERLVRPANDYYTAKLWFQGNYAVYHGKFFNDRLGIIAGLRQDRFQAYEERWAREARNPDNIRTGTVDAYYNFQEPVKVTTGSFGITYALTNSLNIYGVVAEGVIPNTGQSDGAGNSILPEQTLSKEIGLKFDFLDGRISGSVAAFIIDRKNAIWQYGNAPAPGRWREGPLQFSTSPMDAGEIVRGVPISYGVNYHMYFKDLVENEDPQVAAKWREKLGITVNPVRGNFQVPNNRPRLENGEIVGNPSPGVIKILHEGTIGNDASTIVNDNRPYVYLIYDELENDPELKAVMDQAFQDFAQGNHPEGIDPINYRHGSESYGYNASNHPGASVTFEEEATGFDGQLIFTPLQRDNLQFILNFAHVRREATTPFNLVEASDWRYPEFGQISTEYDIWVRDLGPENFEDPKDPTTLKGGIKGKSLYFGSRNTVSFWGRYQIPEGPLENLVFGLGVLYTGSAQTFIPISSTLAENRYPTPNTEAFYQLNAMIQYRRSFERFDLSLRANFYNILNKKMLYSEVTYQNVDHPELTETRRTIRDLEPFSMRLSVTISF